MARYKLTKTDESQGDNHFYSIECMDEWDFTLVSWDYKKGQSAFHCIKKNHG